MLPIKKWSVLLLSFALATSVLTACQTGDDEKAKAKEETSQNEPQPGNSEENPLPIVKVDLGMKPDETVAKYEGGTLTAGQFKDYLEIQAFVNPQAGLAINEKDPEALKLFVDSYVGELKMAEKAPESSDYKKGGEDITGRILEQYKMVYGGDEKKVEQQMKDQGVTKEELQDFFIRYKRVEAYLRSQTSDEDLKKQYEEMKKEGQLKVASVRHILIMFENRTPEEAKKLADEIADRLRKGEDFAQLAKEKSEDPGSKDNGGLYEDYDVNMWVPEFKKAALELPLNEISDPVKTDYGYHVIKVEKRSERSFEDVKEALRNQLINTKYDEFMKNNVEKMVKEVHLPEKPKQ